MNDAMAQLQLANGSGLSRASQPLTGSLSHEDRG